MLGLAPAIPQLPLSSPSAVLLSGEAGKPTRGPTVRTRSPDHPPWQGKVQPDVESLAAREKGTESQPQEVVTCPIFINVTTGALHKCHPTPFPNSRASK